MSISETMHSFPREEDMGKEYVDFGDPTVLGLELASHVYLQKRMENKDEPLSERMRADPHNDRLYVAEQICQNFPKLVGSLGSNPRYAAYQLEKIITETAHSMGFRMNADGQAVQLQ